MLLFVCCFMGISGMGPRAISSFPFFCQVPHSVDCGCPLLRDPNCSSFSFLFKIIFACLVCMCVCGSVCVCVCVSMHVENRGQLERISLLSLPPLSSPSAVLGIELRLSSLAVSAVSWAWILMRIKRSKLA